MVDKEFPPGRSSEPIGLVRLVQELGLSVPLPAVRSEVVAGARKTRIVDGTVIEQYPPIYSPKSLVGHLRFAMRHEPVDLAVLHAALKVFDQRLLEGWIRQEQTGVFARRAWCLFELLTERTLDVPDVPPTGYISLLDPRIHVTGSVIRARRQRVNNNLIGDATYCPLIRRTEIIGQYMLAGLDKEALTLIEGCDPAVIARAVDYLYTKETKSSYAIEGEPASTSRTERFVAALSAAGDFNALDVESFVRLQNAIVDPRYAQKGWRKVQNWVGQTHSDFTERVHYVCPKPDDVGPLMDAWMGMVRRIYESRMDAVCAAAASSFGCVFIHPFEDGNGRIHRFLIHHILARLGFSPHGLLFPVSAVMLRDRRAYDRVLSRYSTSVMRLLQFELDAHGQMSVQGATKHLYQFWDATPFAEYLYSCVEQAIRHDLKEEIGFLSIFDEAVRRTMEIVDMPDRRASALVRFILLNKGTLGKNRRAQFAELSDQEVGAIESAVQSSMARGLRPEGSQES